MYLYTSYANLSCPFKISFVFVQCLFRVLSKFYSRSVKFVVEGTKNTNYSVSLNYWISHFHYSVNSHFYSHMKIVKKRLQRK